MRHHGNKICPEERTDGRTDGQPEYTMPSRYLLVAKASNYPERVPCHV